MSDSVTCDVVIWGAAITGSALARELAARGRQVILLPMGPANYPVLPGVALVGDRLLSRAARQAELIDEAIGAGVTIIESDVVSVDAIAMTVSTDSGDIRPRCIVFADGADPRIARSHGLLPDWEPWQLVHFAWAEVAAKGSPRVIAGDRDGHPWRAYLVPGEDRTLLGAGWSLQSEVDARTHVSELLEDAARTFGVAAPGTKAMVEVVPWEPRRVIANLMSGGLLAVGDVCGVINPYGLHRAEQSEKMALIAATEIDRVLAERSAFDRRRFQALMRPLLETPADGGPRYPAIPRYESRRSAFVHRIGRWLDRRS